MKILLFNDNPVVRKLVALSAQKTKDELSVVWSIDEIEESDFDLLIIDDALYSDEVYAALKEAIRCKTTLLMATRGNAVPGGFDKIIHKPFLPTDLVDLFIQIEKHLPAEEGKAAESDEFEAIHLENQITGLDEFNEEFPPAAAGILDQEEVQEVRDLLEDAEKEEPEELAIPEEFGEEVLGHLEEESATPSEEMLEDDLEMGVLSDEDEGPEELALSENVLETAEGDEMLLEDFENEGIVGFDEEEIEGTDEVLSEEISASLLAEEENSEYEADLNLLESAEVDEEEDFLLPDEFTVQADVEKPEEELEEGLEEGLIEGDFGMMDEDVLNDEESTALSTSEPEEFSEEDLIDEDMLIDEESGVQSAAAEEMVNETEELAEEEAELMALDEEMEEEPEISPVGGASEILSDEEFEDLELQIQEAVEDLELEDMDMEIDEETLSALQGMETFEDTEAFEGLSEREIKLAIGEEVEEEPEIRVGESEYASLELEALNEAIGRTSEIQPDEEGEAEEPAPTSETKEVKVSQTEGVEALQALLKALANEEVAKSLKGLNINININFGNEK